MKFKLKKTIEIEVEFERPLLGQNVRKQIKDQFRDLMLQGAHRAINEGDNIDDFTFSDRELTVTATNKMITIK